MAAYRGRHGDSVQTRSVHPRKERTECKGDIKQLHRTKAIPNASASTDRVNSSREPVVRYVP